MRSFQDNQMQNLALPKQLIRDTVIPETDGQSSVIIQIFVYFFKLINDKLIS